MRRSDIENRAADANGIVSNHLQEARVAWDGKIATEALVRSHPELHHYTSIAGLEGIVGTGTLWSTFYRNLNDASEVVHLRAPLIDALALRYRHSLVRWRGLSLKKRRQIEGTGGVVATARGLAEDLIGALYQVGFTDEEQTPLAPPYITSFCSHAGDKEYERQNGLLSQWRGYGARDGVCLVFDTVGLVELMTCELNAHYWVHLSLDTAQYASDQHSIDELFPDLLQECETILQGQLDHGRLDDVSEALFLTLLAGATRYKHRAFAEEREVRFVGIPGTERALAKMKQEAPNFDPAPLKPIQIGERGGREVHRIVLFEGFHHALPLRRAIIGPSAKQQEFAARARAVMPKTVPITLSETPLVDG